MKKQKKPHGLPGQMPPTEADKILEQQRREGISTMYSIFRCIFEQECIQLGVQEMAMMDYRQEGTMATVKPLPFPEQQKDKRHQFMEDRLIDFHRMTKKNDRSSVIDAIEAVEQQCVMLRDMLKVADTPPKPEPAPILGADGLPVSSVKANEEKELAPKEATA